MVANALRRGGDDLGAMARVGGWSLEYKADRLLVVVPGSIDDHKGPRYARACRAAEEVLGSEFLEMFEADAWPVTQLFGHTSTVFVGKFSATVLARVVRREPQLNRWLYSLSGERIDATIRFRHARERCLLLLVGRRHRSSPTQTSRTASDSRFQWAGTSAAFRRRSPARGPTRPRLQPT